MFCGLREKLSEFKACNLSARSGRGSGTWDAAWKAFSAFLHVHVPGLTKAGAHCIGRRWRS